jgi:transcriptional regulator NrdR family protein
MKCPICLKRIQVSDSRVKENGRVVKRRRRCYRCNQAWITYEEIPKDSNIHSIRDLPKQNATPAETYQEILRLLNLLGQSTGIDKLISK